MQGPWEALQTFSEGVKPKDAGWVSGARHDRQPGPTSKDARVPLGRLLILTQRVHYTRNFPSGSLQSLWALTTVGALDKET